MAFRTTSWKQTEIGKVPSDWDVKALGEIFRFSAGGDVDKNTFSADKTDSHIYPIYANALVDEGLYGYSSKYNVEPEAVTITGRGDVGKVFYRSGKFTPIVRLLTGIADKVYDTKFLSYACGFIKFNIESTGVPQLTVPQVEGYFVGFPIDKIEQTVIAEVLSDLDELIYSLEKLRDKKQLIKTGAMQELLTARRRLPGFKNPWKESALEELGTFTGSGVDKTINKNETPVRLLNYMDVYKRDFLYSNEIQHWVTAPNDKLEKCAIKQGDVFFTPSSETPFDIALSAVAMEDIPNAVYSYHTNRLRIYKDWDLKFKTYIFKTRFFLEQAETMCEGSGTRYVITLPKFRSLKVKYPTDKEEQAAIGNILYDIDAEIDAITKKINKYRAIKDGAASELLSGRIRLIKPKAEV